jgi:hypothetical protein
MAFMTPVGVIFTDTRADNRTSCEAYLARGSILVRAVTEMRPEYAPPLPVERDLRIQSRPDITSIAVISGGTWNFASYSDGSYDLLVRIPLLPVGVFALLIALWIQRSRRRTRYGFGVVQEAGQ